MFPFDYNSKPYPYDSIIASRSFSFVRFAGYSAKNYTELEVVNIPVIVSWQIADPNWEISKVYRYINNDAYRFDMVLRRPLLYQIITPVLLITMIILISIIVVVRSLEGLAQVAAGILFGIWGARQIVLLPEATSIRMLDACFVFLYIALIAAILIRILIVPSLSKHFVRRYANAVRNTSHLDIDHN